MAYSLHCATTSFVKVFVYPFKLWVTNFVFLLFAFGKYKNVYLLLLLVAGFLKTQYNVLPKCLVFSNKIHQTADRSPSIIFKQQHLHKNFGVLSLHFEMHSLSEKQNCSCTDICCNQCIAIFSRVFTKQ